MRYFKKGLMGVTFALTISAVSFPVFSQEAIPERVPENTQAGTQFSDDQKKEINTIVREYILKNPKVLTDSLQALEKEQQILQQLEQQKNYETAFQTLAKSPASLVIGNPDGDVTIIEFFDYNCGYCKRAVADIQTLIEQDPNLKVILRDYPILGPASVEASRISLAVKQQVDQKKMFEFHHQLISTQGRIDVKRAKSVAQTLGVDMLRLETDLKHPAVETALIESDSVGNLLGLQGTPAFMVGGEVIPGAIGIEPLKNIIANVRKCGKASCNS